LRINRGDGAVGDYVGTIQNDAIRNIKGTITLKQAANVTSATGAFFDANIPMYENSSGTGTGVTGGFDASRVVPVGLDNRPKNISVLKTINWGRV
jgi:hypothetical protein